MNVLLSLALLAASVHGPGCLNLRHYKKTTIEWADEAEYPNGFYWVDAVHCGRELGRVYVVVSFWDAQNRHLTDSFWAFDFNGGSPSRTTNRFTAPRMVRPYEYVTMKTITNNLMEAICLTDRARCPGE